MLPFSLLHVNIRPHTNSAEHVLLEAHVNRRLVVSYKMCRLRKRPVSSHICRNQESMHMAMKGKVLMAQLVTVSSWMNINVNITTQADIYAAFQLKVLDDGTHHQVTWTPFDESRGMIFRTRRNWIVNWNDEKMQLCHLCWEEWNQLLSFLGFLYRNM